MKKMVTIGPWVFKTIPGDGNFHFSIVHRLEEDGVISTDEFERLFWNSHGAVSLGYIDSDGNLLDYDCLPLPEREFV